MRSNTPEAPPGLPIVRVNCPIAGVGVAYTTRGLTSGHSSKSRPQADAVQGEGRSGGVHYYSGASQPPFDAFNLGLHVGDDARTVKANRLALAQDLGAQPFWLNQVHGTQVYQIDPSGQGSWEGSGQDGATNGPHSPDETSLGPQADASICSLPGQACAILTADCLPVLVASASGQVVGAAHAGWRGLAQGVIPAVIDAMQTTDPAACRAGLWAWLGPCIGPKQFEVGQEVVQALEACCAMPQHFRPSPAGRWLANLQAIAARQIQQAVISRNIPLIGIESENLCTFSNPSAFYSYRREAKTGRMAAVIWRDAGV
jgi:YfiH family protein